MSITTQDLHAMLDNKRGAFFVTIVASTDARLKKTGNPFKGVRKVARVNGLLNWIYANSVNNQRVRENTPTNDEGEVIQFIAEPRKWGERVRRADGTISPFVQHKDSIYIELKVQRSLGYQYFDADGNELTAEQVAPFLPARSESSRQEVENPVILRDYDLANIIGITFDGEFYSIERQAAEAA